MKSAVENLGPTRVRLTVEVPFAELKPDLDHAYREVAKQVRISGFRPGKVPPRIIDQRVGRGMVLEHAVQDAVPRLYGTALRENDVQVVGQPEVEVTRFTDGEELVFTAEVDVRPEIELPEYDGLPVTVDDAEVSDEQVDEHLAGLRDRFAVLRAAERPVERGDFVLLDLHGTVDGTEVPGATASSLSYEVGEDDLVPGLDEAILGASEGESRTFQTELHLGEYAGRTGEMSVTVRSVKVKELPELDDEFAQTASEFDTIAELRADTRDRLGRLLRLQQGGQARDRVLEVLLERVDAPLPETLVKSETQWRLEDLTHRLEEAGLSVDDYLAAEGRSQEELEQEIDAASRQAVKAQFVLEAVAGREQLGIEQAELTDFIVRRARQSGTSPDAYARSVRDSGSLGALAAEVVRAKALALLLERATVTDASGRPVDLDALQAELAPAGSAQGAPVQAG